MRFLSCINAQHSITSWKSVESDSCITLMLHDTAEKDKVISGLATPPQRTRKLVLNAWYMDKRDMQPIPRGSDGLRNEIFTDVSDDYKCRRVCSQQQAYYTAHNSCWCFGSRATVTPASHGKFGHWYYYSHMSASILPEGLHPNGELTICEKFSDAASKENSAAQQHSARSSLENAHLLEAELQKLTCDLTGARALS